MPIYEYECGECGHRLEALQKISEPPLRDCPECSEPALERLISPAAFHLKGTGWYATDFRDKGKAKDAKEKENEKETKTEAEGNGKAERKSAEGGKSEKAASQGSKGSDQGASGASDKGASSKRDAGSKPAPTQ